MPGIYRHDNEPLMETIMRRSRAIALALVVLAFVGLTGCGVASSDAPGVTIPTNGTPVMVELYTDW